MIVTNVDFLIALVGLLQNTSSQPVCVNKHPTSTRQYLFKKKKTYRNNNKNNIKCNIWLILNAGLTSGCLAFAPESAHTKAAFEPRSLQSLVIHDVILIIVSKQWQLWN